MANVEVDLLVVGLGPAGACAASTVAKAGYKTLAIDRKKKAGFPVQCAEFVPQMMGVEVKGLSKTITQAISSMDTYVQGQELDTMEHFPGQMIDRGGFDRHLVSLAQENGAECSFGISLVSIDNSGLATLSNGDKVKAKAIIGADGPRSKVGHEINQVNSELLETRQIAVELLKPHFATDIFLNNDIPGGYAWLFPKGNVANIGLGLIPQEKAKLKPVLEKLHEKLQHMGRVGSEIKGYTGGAIPVGGMLKPNAFKGDVLVLLAGDAAGLTNPITGAGINAAVMSGQLAGDCVAQSLAGDGGAVEDYIDELQALFGRSLSHAVNKRSQIMSKLNKNEDLSAMDMKSGWIAFDEYWSA